MTDSVLFHLVFHLEKDLKALRLWVHMAVAIHSHQKKKKPKTAQSSKMHYQMPKPGRNDVLFGKGLNVRKHTGNRYYWSLIMKRRVVFTNSENNTEKDQIVQEILDDVKDLSPPGRYLVNKGGDEWEEQVDAIMFSKIKQTLMRLSEMASGKGDPDLTHKSSRRPSLSNTSKKATYGDDKSKRKGDATVEDSPLQCQGNQIATLPVFNSSGINFGVSRKNYSPLFVKNSPLKASYGQAFSSDTKFYP